MKRLLVIAALAACIAACNQNAATDKTAATTAPAADSIKYPYKATYSSSFMIGDPANAKTILDLWKSFEENRLQDSKESWADTVTMEFADGYKFHGSRDSLLSMGAAVRGKYSAMIDSVEAWVPLHSNDKNEDWVGVWGMEYATAKTGKKDTTDLHEVWQLKNGKVVYMIQFAGKRKM